MKQNRTSQYLNIRLIQEAVRTGTEIILIPRRSHTIKGVPVEYDGDVYRVYIDTGRNIETVLLGEIGHASFPRELYQSMQKEESNEESPSPKQQAEKIAKMLKEESIQDKMLKLSKEKQKKEKKKKTNKCPNCGKESPENRLYCDEKCFKEYQSKKLSQKIEEKTESSETPFMDSVKEIDEKE